MRRGWAQGRDLAAPLAVLAVTVVVDAVMMGLSGRWNDDLGTLDR
jgi:hypothetical protein